MGNFLSRETNFEAKQAWQLKRRRGGSAEWRCGAGQVKGGGWGRENCFSGRLLQSNVVHGYKKIGSGWKTAPNFLAKPEL